MTIATRNAVLDSDTCEPCTRAHGTRGSVPFIGCMNPNGCRCLDEREPARERPAGAPSVELEDAYVAAARSARMGNQVFQSSHCGCCVDGDGNLQSPLHVVHCPKHGGTPRLRIASAVREIRVTNWTAGGGDALPAGFQCHVRAIDGQGQVEIRLLRNHPSSLGSVLLMIFPAQAWLELAAATEAALAQLPVILGDEGPKS